MNKIDVVLNAIVILTLVSLVTSPLWIPVVFEYELAEELTPEPSPTPIPTPTPTPPPPTNETIRIMPLGDSITAGESTGGYRPKLYFDLTNAGFIANGDQNVTEVADILNQIDLFENDYNKSVTVILARIILLTDDPTLNETTKEFNNAVVAMAQARIANGDDIIVVDMENALTYPDDMMDGEHPNVVGYEKMADTWLEALMPILATT